MGDDRNELKAIVPGRAKRKKEPARSQAMERFRQRVLPIFTNYGVFWVLLVLLLVGFFSFRKAYLYANETFLVYARDIRFTGASEQVEGLLRQMLSESKPVNGFKLMEGRISVEEDGYEDILKRLQRMPQLRRVQMVYRPGEGVEVQVEERLPVAQLAGLSWPLVVDEEGVCFSSANRRGLPELSGFIFSEKGDPEPGDRLPEGLKCMLHLVGALGEKEYKLPRQTLQRVTLLGETPDDGLLLTLSDGKRVEIAWENMGCESGYSEAMLARLKNLRTFLSDPQMSRARRLNAMARDRIAVVLPE